MTGAPGGGGGVGVLEAANSGEGLWGEIWLWRPPMCLLRMAGLLDGGGVVEVQEAANSGEGVSCEIWLWRPPKLLRTFDTGLSLASAERGDDGGRL